MIQGISYPTTAAIQAPKDYSTRKPNTPLDVMQDVVKMEKAQKLADRYAELKSKPSGELTVSEKFELAYYNSLKVIAKLSQGNHIEY